MSKILTVVTIFYLLCKYHIIFLTIPLTVTCIRDYCTFSSIDLLKDFFFCVTYVYGKYIKFYGASLFFPSSLPAFHLPVLLFPLF